MSATLTRQQSFEVIPAIDLLGGQVVRLTRGDFDDVQVYGDADAVLDSLAPPAGTRLHVVDLEGSRTGQPVAVEIMRRLAERDLRVQVGGGVRKLADAAAWLNAGAEKVVIGTIAADQPRLFRQLVDALGADRIVPAVDVRDGTVRVAGWQRDTQVPLEEVIRLMAGSGIPEILVTDISRDGAMAGPSVDLYRRLSALTRCRVIASGGVASLGDVASLARLPNLSGCVIGKALLERRFTLEEARERAAWPNAIPERIIPCLDVRDGRVVKGVSFENLRDAGDPVECAARYEQEGADEIVILDVSASDRGVATAVDVVSRIAEQVFIPITIGGGVRTVDDFRSLLRAGADRVAVNTAAVRNPDLIREAATEFGVQAVVLSCDAKQRDTGYEVMVRSGKEATGLDAVEWCRRAETLGCGEILLTSVDRDGTSAGYDIGLLRAVTAAVRIGVIASGGAGELEHFREAIQLGGARAVLAASLFHDRKLSIAEVKAYLASEGIPVR